MHAGDIAHMVENMEITSREVDYFVHFVTDLNASVPIVSNTERVANILELDHQATWEDHALCN